MPKNTPAPRTGARLVELRRSNASGRHDHRPRRARTRAAARRAALRDQQN